MKNILFFITEPVPVACSRVDALRSHGYTSEALRLAVAVVRTLKQAQREAYLWWGSKRDEMLPRCSASRACRSLGPGALESWVGHPLDPITCLFDTLAEASLLPEDLPRFQYHSGKYIIQVHSTELPGKKTFIPFFPDTCLDRKIFKNSTS